MLNLRFGQFELRTGERLLLSGGVLCPLGSRAFDVLLALIERRDRVVTKNELLELVWPGLVVEENNLSVQISTLRRVLGSKAIATVTGRGYRFSLPCDVGHTASIHAPEPAEARITRRVIALACAAVTDWSRHLESDLQTAVRSWRSTRANIIEVQIPRFGGTAIEITAERLLVSFNSAVDAVAWSLDLMERLTHARGEQGDASLRMRVGVLIEDSIIDSGRIVGDAVHLAERLARLAADDQVVVTDLVRDFVSKRLPVSFKDLGEQQPSNFGRSVHVYRVVADVTTPPPVGPNPSLMWKQQPSIAVLPFDSGGSELETYFGDGMTEEIITALSMNRSLFVIARNSTLGFRGATRVSRAVVELGVRYILVGSVRRLAKRLRINVELIDSEVNRVIWGDRCEGEDDDLFTFQAKIAAQISAAIDPRVQEAEIERLRGRPTESFGAYDLMLRGISKQFGPSEEDFSDAAVCFQRAIELDPGYARAHAHLGWWYGLRIGEGRSDRPDSDKVAADRLFRRAVELDPRDAWILAMAGHHTSFLQKRFAVASEMFTQALELNPNCAAAWARSGTTLAYIGRGDEALERVRNAMRLSPLDQQGFSFCTTNGIACIVRGRYDEAIGWLSRALRFNPRYRAASRMLIAAQGLAGEVMEAQERGRDFMKIDPTFRISSFGAWYPLQSPYLEHVLEGLRIAQLPE